jgi:hypothetical protein
MEILDNSEIGSESNFTGTMKAYLTETAKWGKFLSIIGFIGVAIMVILAFSIGAIFSQFANQPGMAQFGAVGGTAMFTFIYLFFAALWFFPTFYLFRFSTGILRNLPTMDVAGIESSFGNLKSVFKFYGVFTLIFVIIYGSILVIGLIAGSISLLS